MILKNLFSSDILRWASLAAQMVKNLLAMQKIRVQSLSQEDLLEKGMATHSSILAWRIPWTVHGAAKSWTQLKQPSTHIRISEVVTLEGGCEIY